MKIDRNLSSWIVPYCMHSSLSSKYKLIRILFLLPSIDPWRFKNQFLLTFGILFHAECPHPFIASIGQRKTIPIYIEQDHIATAYGFITRCCCRHRCFWCCAGPSKTKTQSPPQEREKRENRNSFFLLINIYSCDQKGERKNEIQLLSDVLEREETKEKREKLISLLQVAEKNVSSRLTFIFLSSNLSNDFVSMHHCGTRWRQWSRQQTL